MEPIIRKYQPEVSALCQNHNVKSLYAFGSALTPRFNTDSDVDLIVDFLPLNIMEYADNYFDLKFSGSYLRETS